MKNSTIAKIITICMILSPLFWYFTIIMIEIIIIIITLCLLFYLFFSFFECLDDYDYPIIKKEYNIFFHIGRFFRWLDSKPKIIKPTKKNWRSPEDWDNEL